MSDIANLLILSIVVIVGLLVVCKIMDWWSKREEMEEIKETEEA